MIVRKPIPPMQRLRRVIHIIVCLALFYMTLNSVALLGHQQLTQHGYGWRGLGIALALLALGAGIRYGSLFCLYGVVGLFGSVSLSMFRLFVDTAEPDALLRCTISTWILLILCRAIPAMHRLRQQQVFPLSMSRPHDIAMAPQERNQ